MSTHEFTPLGVCSSKILVEVNDGIITAVTFEDGCPGSLTALSRTLVGMPVEKAAELLKGIPCGGKSTSCPDQLAKALEKIEG